MLKKYIKKRGRKKKFSKEFREHLRIGLTAAIGFTIAFAWREPLILLANNLISSYVNSSIKYQGSVVSALAITFFGVLLIWILSRMLK